MKIASDPPRIRSGSVPGSDAGGQVDTLHFGTVRSVFGAASQVTSCDLRLRADFSNRTNLPDCLYGDNNTKELGMRRLVSEPSVYVSEDMRG